MRSFLFYKSDVVHRLQTPYEALLFPEPGSRSNGYLARLESQCGGSVSHQPGIFLMSGEFAS